MIESKKYGNQVLFGHMPSVIVRNFQGGILAFFILLCSVVCFLDYPTYTIISSEMSNVNTQVIVYSEYQGKIHSVYPSNGSLINMGDTLCMIEKDSLYYFVIAKNHGQLFMTNEMQENNYVDYKTSLCIIVDKLSESPFSTLFVNEDMATHMKVGMEIDGEWELGQLKGQVIQIASFPNPQSGKYAVKIKWRTLTTIQNFPFYKKNISVKLRLSNTKIWKMIFN